MNYATSSMAARARSDAQTADSRTWRFTPLAIPDVMVIEPPRFTDARGWFSETYNARVFAEQGLEMTFVQDNLSCSAVPGTVRGLHYQSPPFAQDKLVRVLNGRILDVAVDIRRDSSTYGGHVSIELSAADGRALLVPAGFAHGFITREPDTVVSYKVSSLYAPNHDHGIFWADPELGIDWGVFHDDTTVSEKDQHQPSFSEFVSPFNVSDEKR